MTHRVNLAGSTESFAVALADYQSAWKAFIVVHHLEALERLLKPTTISWKVADKTVLFANLEAIGAAAEQTHIGTVNGRFIASSLLHEPLDGMSIIKILERRQGSNDRLGLDSIDYLVADIDEAYTVLKAADAHVAHEHNDMHAWLSLRFGKNLEHEAKITDHLVLDVAIKEMRQARDKLKNTFL